MSAFNKNVLQRTWDYIVYEILSEWSVSKKIIMAIPDYIIDAFHISGSFQGTIKTITLFTLLPLIFYFVLASIKKYFTHETWENLFTQLVLAILPITASMHLLKALLKTTSRIPYWNYAISNPRGVQSADLILSFYVIRKREHTSRLSKTISILAVLIYSSIFLTTLIIWRMT